tara:strand:- start:296 stop:802 length:507 start_codon:yes stop_codon:yes gene_type:complete
MDWILAKLPLTIRVLSRLKRTLLTLPDCRSNTWTTPSNPNQQHGQQNSHHISPDSDTSPLSAHPSPGVQITSGNTVMVSHKTSSVVVLPEQSDNPGRSPSHLTLPCPTKKLVCWKLDKHDPLGEVPGGCPYVKFGETVTRSLHDLLIRCMARCPFRRGNKVTGTLCPW